MWGRCHFHNRGLTTRCWLRSRVFVGNVGASGHFAITVGSDHKSAWGRVIERVRGGLQIYLYISAGYEELETKRRQRKEREMEISSCTVWLLAVSSVDLLCSALSLRL